MKLVLFIICIMSVLVFGGTPPDGFNGATWASTPDQVKTILNATGWQNDQAASTEFPPGLKVTVYRSSTEIAGRKAEVKYYFWEDRFFQATVVFNFDELKNFDFNYNVYRSVNEYYLAIRSKSLIFIYDVYDLLCKKYGKKEPVFKGLDPRLLFAKLDRYLKQERWNLRYHPYDYYQRIVTAAYARWDFPQTRTIFSVNISALDKRFDFSLSLVSLGMERLISKKMDELRMQGL